MPWYDNLIPDSIKKSVCSCLIKRYLSDFIENEITRDQLNLDLYNGRATAERINLAVESLNELGEAQNWPIELVDGYIDKIHISIPWTSLFSSSTEIEICGLKLTVQPKQRNEDATSMFESMWNSMSSSMQLAKEIAKETTAKRETDNNQPIEGIELFAQTIDTVVKRIKIKLTDTTFQIEHLPKQSEKGVGLLVHIDFMEYFDDFSIEGNDNQGTSDCSKEDLKKAYLVDSVTTKNVLIRGIQLSSVEFSSGGRTVSRSLIREDDRESFNESETDSDTETPQSVKDEDADRHVILCGKCFNNQEVKIRLKQSENSNGPKIAIELNLGSLVLFLSPRQFHILMLLVDGFSSPHLEDNSNVFHKIPQPTRMTEKDYEKVEEQLTQMMADKHYSGFGLLQGHGWSTGAMDESSDSEYITMQAATSTMYDSTMSGCSSSMDSSITSSMITTVTDASSTFKRRVSNIDSDPTAEISHFQVRFATFVGVLLHEDLLVQATGNEKTLVWQMQSLAEKFFNCIDQSTFIGVSSDGFEHVHKSLEKGCNLNHLRLLASPLKLEGSETTTSSAFSMSGHLIASKLELLECLFNESFKYIPLVSFQSLTSANIPSSVRPNLSLKFKHVQRTGRGAGQYRRRGPKTEVSIHLDSCSAEFDLSIVDRISSLLHHPTICTAQAKDPNLRTPAQQFSAGGTVAAKSVQDFKISCPLFKFTIRFPIPDFRPATDMSKPPWWERNVRPDYLTLVLRNAAFRTTVQTDQSHNEYNVECKLLDIFYYENDRACGIHIARCGLDEEPLVSMQNEHALLTKLAIKIFSKTLGDDDNTIPIDPMTHSFYGAFENQGNPDPGPFGAKRVVHKSDTPHENVKKEEQVIPGDNSEIESFIRSAMSNAEILVEVTLPVVSVLLESKHMYELIYNRINNDLLLWQSQAPKPNISNNFIRQFEDLALDSQYILADGGLRNDSDNEDSSEDELANNVFYSTYGSKMRSSAHNTTKAAFKKCKNGQCSFVMSLDIAEGIASLNPPVRDTSSNVIPGQQGELVLHISNSKVFIVSGYKGDEDLGYVSVQVDDAQLYHCDIQPTPCTSSPLREVSAPLGSYLLPTIYKSDKKNISFSDSRAGARQMFTVAIKIQANHETHHVKVVTVSLGLNRATLRHKMGTHPNTWISHLIDFFNVQDDLIPGYIPKDVLTELHLHVWDCSIDYRPLYLPLRSMVTIGSFSMSSHLTAVANTSTLTMIFEDCGLFLSDKAPPRDGIPSTVSVDLEKDYVNVMEIALFEISIKTTDKLSGINPHIDLRLSINKLIIKTCSDTARALFQLLTYYINDGDLNNETQQLESTQSSPCGVMEDELINLEAEQHSLTKSQQDQVSEMLEDAMEESPKSSKTNPTHGGAGAKLFYFPDEKEALGELPSHNVPQLVVDLGDFKEGHFGGKSDIDYGFCFMGDEDVLPKSYVPEITWFSQDVRIIENYMFKPDSKRDVLAPPKSFPTPVTRYTLCDMTIVWQMFGGNDFKKRVKEDQKKEVRFADRQLGDSVSFSNKDRVKVSFNRSEDARTKGLSWIHRGGVNRDHTVLMELQLSKVKFSHEVYPETTKQASRQVLSIFNVEIRDRLAQSEINKFLYQWSSHNFRRQSHANMVLVKALHLRPDPKVKQEECNLKISLMPIRLNIDQDSLFFLIKFFKELNGESVDEPVADSPKDCSLPSNISHHPPIMTTSLVSDREIEQKAKEVVTENLILLESRYHTDPDEMKEPSTPGGASSDTSPIYFRSVEFSKDVLIRLDYVPKRVDMSHGPIAGFLMGLTFLKCSEIRLKRIVHRHGLLGFNKLIEFLLQEWVADIKKNQLSTILGGIGPMKAVIQLFQGFKDLFWMPIQQYQKDGRIVRGLQRGANSFTTSTAMAALELTSRLIYFIQITAETAYDMLSPGPSLRTRRLAKRKERKKRYHQPQDIREGLTNACMVVKEGIGETVENLFQVAALENEQKGISGAVGAVIRQIPPTIFKPIIIATDATSNLVGGVQSQLVPDVRKEANEKWRSDS